MKTKAIISMIAGAIMIFTNVCYSQSSKKVLYKALLTTNLQKGKISGILQNVTDSTLIISQYKKDIEVTASSISNLRIRRINSAGRGVLIGGVVGFGIGAIIGFASGDDEPDTWFAMTAEEKSGTGGVMLGIAGAGIGALCGLGYKENIDINYDITRFQSSITLLKKYESSPQDSSKK